MNLRFDLHVLGWLLVFASGFLAVPAGTAALFGEPVGPYSLSASGALLIGAVIARATRHADRRIRTRDGFLIVSGSWLLVSLLGACPYLLSGALAPVDALFESVSGFTTTGSTVIADVTLLPRALLLWRAMTQWLGGMGIILFAIAILPLLGIGGMQLFKAEVPGPVADKVRPRLAATARMLWAIYVGFTALEWALLRLAGLSTYESLCHSFTTLATGGFSTRNLSIGELGSPLIEWIIVVFMLLAGINFVLHYRLLTGRVRDVAADPELRLLLKIVAVGVAICGTALVVSGTAPLDAIRLACFQVVSIVTTTGYVTTDFELWPVLPQLLLVFLMLVGGMSGSTGGGPKVLRVLLAVRSFRTSTHRLIRPHAVLPLKLGEQVVSDHVLAGVWAFLVAYALVAMVGAAVVAAHGYDLVTSMTAALTATGNVGPGLGAIGAHDNFAHFPGVVKIVLSCCMVLGRLEIFTVLVLFSRRFWRH